MQPTADPTAVTGRRVVAFIIDYLILQAIWSIVFFALAKSASTTTHVCSGTCLTLNKTVYGVGGGKAALLWTIYWAYAIGIFVFLQGAKGFTPGKAIMGVRVVNGDGQAPGPVKAFIRWILLIVDLLPYCIPGLLGFILILTGKEHQRLGDRAAKTFVVGKASMGQPVGGGAATADGPYGTPMGATAPAYGATPSYGAPEQPYGAPAQPYGAPAPAPAADPFAPAAPLAADPYAPAPAAADAAAASANEPQWDAARNAYIQWDANQQAWLQFDDATQQWRPIDQ